MSVHTAELGHLAWNTPGLKTLATVPVGETWIVKDVRAFNGSSATLTFNLYVVRSTVGHPVLTISVPTATAAGVMPWIVMEPGDVLQEFNFGTPTAMCYLWISGSKLTGVAA